MGIAAKEPCPVVVSVALHYQRVSVPAPYRVSHPARVGIRFQGAAIHVDLAESEIFLQDDDHRRSLKDSLRTSTGAVVRTVGQAFVMGIVNAEVLSALLNQLSHPSLNVGRLEVPRFAERHIAAADIVAGHCPDR